MANKDQSSNPEYFVKIDEPMTLRKNLLGTSRDVIISLKKYDDFRDIRTEKVEYILKLGSIIDDINMLLSRLKSSMPTETIRQEQKKEAKKAEPARSKAKPVRKWKIQKSRNH